MTLRVIGLDLSTASSGVAGPTDRCRTIVPLAKDRTARLNEIVSRLDTYLRLGVDLAVIERPVVGRGGVATMEILAEVHGAVKLRLGERGVKVALVTGSTLKKFATGDGSHRTSKDDMVSAALGGGAVVSNDDEADAWWLRMMGLMQFGADEPLFRRAALRQARLECVGVVKWPAVMGAGR